MTKCPRGHLNPSGWELCGECGAPIDSDDQAAATEQQTIGRLRTVWAAAGIVLLVGAAFVAGALVFRSEPRQMPSVTDPVAVREWWAGSHDTISGLRTAIDDSRRAVEQLDTAALQPACRQMHDLAGVRLPALLPSPDGELTSELAAAAGDAHEAAHMCLAAIAGSMNSYRGEFAATLDQAEANLTAAQGIIDEMVTTGVYTC
ncbi:hypothetical protein [Mycolicibacterium goodii]|uniref:hypothetical protein n=1 Tax=Mycolicibacterium goodii TaxID=134601 RepID=UPI001BDCF8CC|nr:hypothetical protein [Mycolicibacterium goodii]MBU8831877.1 hypothetical protein [Mycolicibacterium goodii]ULN45419.1 hypothetical protein MI170_18840 [Mycolicibacterium goodii]